MARNHHFTRRCRTPSTAGKRKRTPKRSACLTMRRAMDISRFAAGLRRRTMSFVLCSRFRTNSGHRAMPQKASDPMAKIFAFLAHSALPGERNHLTARRTWLCLSRRDRPESRSHLEIEKLRLKPPRASSILQDRDACLGSAGSRTKEYVKQLQV
jgi:hypothetical protein